jgi:CRP-like cAMP-binding protein
LENNELDFLVDGKQQIIYKPGETIIKQNTSSTYVVCIRKGLAKVYVEGVKGKSLIVGWLEDTILLPEVIFLTEMCSSLQFQR